MGVRLIMIITMTMNKTFRVVLWARLQLTGLRRLFRGCISEMWQPEPSFLSMIRTCHMSSTPGPLLTFYQRQTAMTGEAGPGGGWLIKNNECECVTSYDWWACGLRPWSLPKPGRPPESDSGNRDVPERDIAREDTTFYIPYFRKKDGERGGLGMRFIQYSVKTACLT